MASKKNTVKVAYDLAPEAKHTLAVLKADLRLKGIAATETGILEVLIGLADVRRLAAEYRRYLG